MEFMFHPYYFFNGHSIAPKPTPAPMTVPRKPNTPQVFVKPSTLGSSPALLPFTTRHTIQR